VAARYLVLAGLTALTGLTLPLPAQTVQPEPSTELVLEMITITASAGENLVGSSSTVSLLDRKTLDRFAFRSVADALDSLSGMAVQRTYLKQGLLTSRGILQDMYANKNLVMIDGVPLWHAVSGEHNLDRVGLPELRRIEALRARSHCASAPVPFVPCTLRAAAFRTSRSRSGWWSSDRCSDRRSWAFPSSR
jgi:outer membrane cobalamin receptor